MAILFYWSAEQFATLDWRCRNVGMSASLAEDLLIWSIGNARAELRTQINKQYSEIFTRYILFMCYRWLCIMSERLSLTVASSVKYEPQTENINIMHLSGFLSLIIWNWKLELVSLNGIVETTQKQVVHYITCVLPLGHSVVLLSAVRPPSGRYRRGAARPRHNSSATAMRQRRDAASAHNAGCRLLLSQHCAPCCWLF